MSNFDPIIGILLHQPSPMGYDLTELESIQHRVPRRKYISKVKLDDMGKVSMRMHKCTYVRFH